MEASVAGAIIKQESTMRETAVTLRKHVLFKELEEFVWISYALALVLIMSAYDTISTNHGPIQYFIFRSSDIHKSHQPLQSRVESLPINLSDAHERGIIDHEHWSLLLVHLERLADNVQGQSHFVARRKVPFSDMRPAGHARSLASTRHHGPASSLGSCRGL